MTALSVRRPPEAGTRGPRLPATPVLPSAAGAAATVLLAVSAWALALRRMTGMDMGPATGLGSLPSFAARWVPMMAAMMLPGALPAVWRLGRPRPRGRAVPSFLVLYLAVWALAGAVVYCVYRPHGHVAAGLATVAAGLYEFCPLKAHFRRRCHNAAGSGLRFGLCCLGSSAGLMIAFVSLGIMSVTWMALVTGLVLIQKVLPARSAVDVPVALAVLTLGALVLVAPWAVR
jgi:predicted metal-binding membrane protein